MESSLYQLPTSRRALLRAMAGAGASGLLMSHAARVGAQGSNRVRFGNQPVINFAPFGIAQAVAAYKGRAEMAPTIFDNGPLVIQAMLGGSVDAGLVGASPVVNAASSGLPIRVISAICDPSRCFSMIASNKYATVKDLAGKKIATGGGTVFQYFMERALAKYGMTTKDIQFQDMQLEQARGAFVAGQIDAIVPRETDRLSILRDRPDSKVLIDADGFTKGGGSKEPFVVYDLAVATADSVNKARAGLTGMLAAYHGSVVPFLKGQTPAAITEITRWLQGVGNAKAAEDAVKVQLGFTEFLDAGQVRRVMTEGALKKALVTNAEFLKSIGKIPAVPDFDKVIDTSLLPKA